MNNSNEENFKMLQTKNEKIPKPTKTMIQPRGQNFSEN